jgi:hypothetical protein
MLLVAQSTIRQGNTLHYTIRYDAAQLYINPQFDWGIISFLCRPMTLSQLMSGML